MKAARFALLFSVVAAASAPAAVPGPMDALRGPVSQVIDILKDPQYRTASRKDAQKDRLWEIVRGIFDFGEISARAVGRNWSRFDAGRKEAFTDAFSTLLGNTYLGRIQGAYKDEKVEFLGQELLESTTARVRTRIIREADAIAVDYSLRLEGEGWKVYDVAVEGVSLVQNYRSQFDQILVKETPDQLIERVRVRNRAPEAK